MAADGSVTGDGLALDLFEAEAEAREEFFALLPSLGFPDATAPENDQLWATMAALKAEKQAQVIYDAIALGVNP